MTIFGTDSSRRGCFVAFTSDIDKGHGSILQMPLGEIADYQELPEGANFEYPAIVTNIQIQQQENVHFLKCFNQRIYTYTFGADLGNITVNYLAFLARGVAVGAGQQAPQVNNNFSQAVRDFLESYREGRVSFSRRFATLSFGGVSKIRGLVTGMSSQTANAETSLQNFSLKLTTVEALEPS